MTDFRRHALKGLKLKTVIKESHCSEVQHLAFNLSDVECNNLFATVAKDQATIYDDQHMADHIAVVANLALSNSPEQAKDVFHACCWINSSGRSRHPYGDALLAIGGTDPSIHIISVVEAAVVAQLPVPAGATVAELSAASMHPGLLLVLYRDGGMQLWQIGSGRCLWSSSRSDAFTAALHPKGECVVTCSRSGKLSKWDLQPHLTATAAGAIRPSAPGCPEVSKEPLGLDGHDGVVDCMRFLSDDRFATKTTDGHMAVYHWSSGKRLSSWRVPGSSSSSSSPSHSNRCSFGHTPDGQYVCVGNHNATAYVYDTATGCQQARVEAIRVSGSVRACGLSEDCRHLVMSVGSGYVFRFEYRLPLEGDDEDDGGEDQEEEEEEENQEAGGVQPKEPGAADDADAGGSSDGGGGLRDEEMTEAEATQGADAGSHQQEQQPQAQTCSTTGHKVCHGSGQQQPDQPHKTQRDASLPSTPAAAAAATAGLAAAVRSPGLPVPGSHTPAEFGGGRGAAFSGRTRLSGLINMQQELYVDQFDLQQGFDPPSGSLWAASEQQLSKKQRVGWPTAGPAGADESPLVFKVTPDK